MIPRWIQNVYILYFSGQDPRDMIAFESNDTDAFVLPYARESVPCAKQSHHLDKRYELLQDFINNKAME